jgi:hypothetical protein
VERTPDISGRCLIYSTMKLSISQFLPLTAFFALALSSAQAQDAGRTNAETKPKEQIEKPLPPQGRIDVEENAKAKNVPEDLLDDDHLQEEAGVSELTTPSIKKIFEDLDSLGTLPYEKLKRAVPQNTPADRTMVALGLGVLIGDGFLSVQSEKIADFEEIGRAVLKYAKVLGAGAKVKERVKAIFESSALGALDWKDLKEQLGQTQREVKHEMVLLRDIDMVHLVSLGGWVRGLQIATTTSVDPFQADKAKVLTRKDIAEYFLATLDSLPPATMKLPVIQELRKGISDVGTLVDVPEGKPFTEEQLQKIKGIAEKMLEISTKF